MGPLFFLRMGLNFDGMQELQEPFKRFFTAMFDLRVALKENVTDQTLKEVEEVLNDISEKIEALSKRIERSV